MGQEWEIIEEALGLTGLVISCLFMVELIVAILSFGMGKFSNGESTTLPS